MSDLWFVPPAQHSAWFTRLDWYLNWQMCKGLQHRVAPPAAELFRLAEEYNVKIGNQGLDSDHAPLLVSGQGLIPARACVVLNFTGELKSWLASAKALAFQMQAEHARIHLPRGAEKAQAVGIWEKLTGHCTAEFIEDNQEHA